MDDMIQKAINLLFNPSYTNLVLIDCILFYLAQCILHTLDEVCLSFGRWLAHKIDSFVKDGK